MGNIRAHNMKVQYQFACGLWEEHEEHSSLTFDCKRLRPRVDPKLQTDPENNVATFDLKSFIRPAESFPGKLGSSLNNKKDDSMERMMLQQQAVGGTRWNPTQEQISILEMLYRGGMRTPNAQQIEEISGQLSKYGKIEGKNVFYWFQNHKARERQKQKRKILCPNQSPTPASAVTSTLPAHQNLDLRVLYSSENSEESILKRKCRRTWTYNCKEEEKRYGREEKEDEDRTLLLFPLHPESR